ncbi:Hypothetical predicted protein [Mytilus galloprovincialis]|uniref:Peptidase metallopeptidase domain-containing protein n=1 Tax=Mytilus galloprovincialis TaxID=29158 RepID=A0A8B6BMY2_MYTGA|nr:Hypothetical predicted protein [Mytilus galloprovincialis]
MLQVSPIIPFVDETSFIEAIQISCRACVKDMVQCDAIDIEILYAKGNHGDGPYNAFDGPERVLAHAFYPTDGETHFDDDETWILRSGTGTDLEIVAAHEFGHALGLGHSQNTASLMAPFYKRMDQVWQLHQDDIKGIQSLYGVPKDQLSAP